MSQKRNWAKVSRLFDTLSKGFDFISSCFSPLLGVMAGSGLLKALVILLEATNMLAVSSGTLGILSAAGNGIFYFLPIFLGISISKRLEADAFVGGAIGASLLEPQMMKLHQTGEALDFLSVPVVLSDYASTVFPILLAMISFSWLEKTLKKSVPQSVQIALVPLVSLLIMVPLTLILFGPLGLFLGDAISGAVIVLSDQSGLLTGAVVGGSWLFLTLIGLHWGLLPIMINNILKDGDPMMAMVSCAVFAQMGVALAVFAKMKDKPRRAFVGTAFLTGALSGVTEPIIFGVLLKNKKTLIYIAVSGAIGGAINGSMGVVSQAFAFPSFLAVAAYFPMGAYLLGISVSFVLSGMAVLLWGYESSTACDAKNPIQLMGGRYENDEKINRF